MAAESITQQDERVARLARAQDEVAHLEAALQQMVERHIGGRQRTRMEVWLQGARVALEIAERETTMATVTNEQAETIRRLTTEALDSYPSLLPMRRKHILAEVEDALTAIAQGNTYVASQTAKGLALQKSRLAPVRDALLAAIGDAPLA